MSPVMGFFGGFFLLWWVDLLRAGQQSLSQLTSGNAGKLFTMERAMALPPLSITAGVCFGLVFLGLAAKVKSGSTRHLAIAGCFAAVAYVPYDAFILYKVQEYPWIPTWFVLSKDLVQDFIAAIICASLYTRPRIAALLASRLATGTRRATAGTG